MVMTKAELIASLENEVRILLHLASKIEPSMLDYRPTPKQRSMMELLQYLSMMGPSIAKAIIDKGFDGAAWSAAEQEASARDFEATLAAIEKLPASYAALIGGLSDEDLRTEIDMFNGRSSRGSLLVNQVLGACAAYRTQLFLYLKSCGREELSTWNLWAGMDPKPAA